MHDGPDYIHLASLQNDELRGSADLLERINQPSKLGAWSYIPIDCKLSSHPKPIYIVQACAYCELLEPILGKRPQHFKLFLGGKKFEKGIDGYNVDDFWMLYRHLRDRYRKFLAVFDSNKQPEFSPGDHGHWTPFIEDELGKNRDLTLVAGMRQSQRKKLISAGNCTIEELANAKVTPIIMLIVHENTAIAKVTFKPLRLFIRTELSKEGFNADVKKSTNMLIPPT